jgi:16S rRNA (guanine966-N2)-methyltransferase
MRIIGGKNKGKTIVPPSDNNTRPLRDIVKEAIFNLIEHSNKFDVLISDSNILDLFSGSGSFGLECISRGAQRVVFIENYLSALKILNRNISNIKGENISQIIEKNCFDFFDQATTFNYQFELIFLDPPYKEKKINLIIEKIKENKILKENGIIIIHRHKNDEVEITNKLNVLDQRIYGISKIIFGN